MKKIYLLVIAIFLMVPLSSSSQGLDCSSATRLCFPTAISSFTYPASVNVPDMGVSGCLYTTPNPAWFFFVASGTGSIDLMISSMYDVDFICWGPFIQPPYPCSSLDISDSTIADCSYLTWNNEVCSIPTAVTGAFYVLLITNYSNMATNVTITQSNYGMPTAGGIQCITTLDSVSSNSPLCQGDTLFFETPLIDSASYYWSGPNGFSSNDQNPAIINVQTAQEGVYSLIVIYNGIVSSAFVNVDVLESPASFMSIESQSILAASFFILSTTDSNIMFFGDGDYNVNVTEYSTVSHNYDSSGSYQVTLISYNMCGADTMSIMLYIWDAGLMDIGEVSASIFPNPTTGKCNLEGLPLSEITLLECRSIDGKLLYSGPAAGINDGSTTLIDLSNYSPGMYTLTIQTSSNRFAVKVIRGEDR